MDLYLECEDIIKIYPQESKVKKATLRGICFSINKGEFISILGPSGCGKTTLLMIIAGLLEPSAGTVKIRNYLVNELSSKEKLSYYRNNIGFMFQNPRENVVWGLNTFDNVILPIILGSIQITTKEKRKRVHSILDQVNLDTKKSRKPKQLSGGEIQRLGVAIALANNPELLILDEPTSQMDTQNAIKLVNYIRLLCTKQGKTVIMVTHDLRMVRRTDHCFIMKEGVLKEIKIEQGKDSN